MKAEIQTTRIVFSNEAECETALALLDAEYPLALYDHNVLAVDVYSRNCYDVTNEEDMKEWSRLISTWVNDAIAKSKGFCYKTPMEKVALTASIIKHVFISDVKNTKHFISDNGVTLEFNGGVNNFQPKRNEVIAHDKNINQFLENIKNDGVMFFFSTSYMADDNYDKPFTDFSLTECLAWNGVMCTFTDFEYYMRGVSNGISVFDEYENGITHLISAQHFNEIDLAVRNKFYLRIVPNFMEKLNQEILN